MCLDMFDTKVKKLCIRQGRSFFAYKVMTMDGNGYLHTIHKKKNQCYAMYNKYTTPRDTILRTDSTKRVYFEGFHCFLSKDVAKRFALEGDRIVRVQVIGKKVFGWEGQNAVVVAQTIKIMQICATIVDGEAV